MNEPKKEQEWLLLALADSDQLIWEIRDALAEQSNNAVISGLLFRKILWKARV